MKKKPYLVYCNYSSTIRQMPENYLIAWKVPGCGWSCNPDLACDVDLAVKVFKTLLIFEFKYGTAENIINYVKELER